jgi:hypothetical protein
MRRRPGKHLWLSLLALVLLAGPTWTLLHYFAPTLFLHYKPDRLIRIQHGNPFKPFKVWGWWYLPNGDWLILAGPDKRLMRLSAKGRLLWEHEIHEHYARVLDPDGEHILLLTQAYDEEDNTRITCLDPAGKVLWQESSKANIRFPGERPVADRSGVVLKSVDSVVKYDLSGKLLWSIETDDMPFLRRSRTPGQNSFWTLDDMWRVDDTGKILWQYPLTDNQKPYEIGKWTLLLHSQGLAALDENGRLLWSKQTNSPAPTYASYSTLASADLAIVKDLKGKLLFINQQGEEVLAYKEPADAKDNWVYPQGDEGFMIAETYYVPARKPSEWTDEVLSWLGIDKPYVEPPANLRLKTITMSGQVKPWLDFKSPASGPVAINDYEYAVCIRDMILVFKLERTP